MARTASPAHRQHLEQLAETWEQLAEARKRKLEKHSKTAEDDYPDTSRINRQIGAPAQTGIDTMIGKRVQFHEETWQQLRLLASESMKSFQELADEAFNDLLRKHGQPASLKEALRRSAGESAKIIPLKGKARETPKKR